MSISIEIQKKCAKQLYREHQRLRAKQLRLQQRSINISGETMLSSYQGQLMNKLKMREIRRVASIQTSVIRARVVEIIKILCRGVNRAFRAISARPAFAGDSGGGDADDGGSDGPSDPPLAQYYPFSVKFLSQLR